MTEFTLRFEGETFADGTIPVELLADTLTSFQNLFDAVNEEMNGPNSPPITLRVKSMSGEPDANVVAEEAGSGPE